MSKKRNDHVWKDQGDGTVKCLWCGAVAKPKPPCPTPKDWMPLRYQLPLTEKEREMAKEMVK